MISHPSRAPFARARFSSVLGLSVALLGSATVHAQNLPDSASINESSATAISKGGAVTVRPGKSSYVTPDLRVAVIGATELGGNVDMARRGMAAAMAAISVLPGYTDIAPRELSTAMQGFKKDALRLPEYQALKKAVKADRVLSITLEAGENSDNVSTYSAVAELFDTTTGGLAGRGEATFTATPADGNPERVPESTLPASNVARGKLVDGTVGTLQERAVDGAIARAVFALNDPLITRGVVLHTIVPEQIRAKKGNVAAPFYARISLGEMTGVRNGAAVEYYSPQGQRLAFGTVVDIGPGEALATIAPENAFPSIHTNYEVRVTDNPPLGRAGRTSAQNDESDWKDFETKFGVSLGIALVTSLIFF